MSEEVVRTLGKYENLVRERQARDLFLSQRKSGHPRGLAWVPEAGERVVTFIEAYCAHHKGEWAGAPLLLEEWQKDIFRQAFGWYRSDGLRRFRTMYVETPRKNGKSELAGALGLYLLVGDNEPGAEVYASATKKDQARIVWSVADAMVRLSPKLKRWIKRYRANLFVERTSSKFEPLGADSDTLDGLNPHGNIVDELHAHKDRSVWDVLDTAMGARRQPMTLAITTAGTYEQETIGWQLHDYAVKVLEEFFVDDSFHAYLTSADEGDDYFASETQRKANPNYGISIKAEYLASQAEKAKRQPSFLNEYLRLHLNVWTQQVTRWLPMDKWAACEPDVPAEGSRAVIEERERALEGRTCRGGLDLASRLDLTALVLAFPSSGDMLDLICRFWIPEETIAAYARKGMRHYEVWARDGWIHATPGSVIDYDFVRAEVMRLVGRYHVEEVAYDPWGATQLAVQLQNEGVAVVETRQGYQTLSEASKDLVARVTALKVRHAGHPVLRFCAANAVVLADAAENIKPDKAKAVGRIDGIVATVMALSRVQRATTSQASYLENEDIAVLG